MTPSSKLSLGDRVEDTSFHVGMTGTVVELGDHNPENPIQEHGGITVRLDDEHVGKFPCSPPDEEHYVEFEWWKFLNKLP